ncbi:MAG: energy transducer TonB [Acidobacteriota bacterium]|nr:energy transducer TonB [Acidobacteriota bacterium]
MARLLCVLGLMGVLVLCLMGQSDDEPVYSIGNGVLPPRITHQVSPEHPANGFRITGTVLVGLIVSSKGEPKDVHVVRSLDKSVDQSAVDAVKQWQFDPATRDGKPVAVRINVEIRFHDM